MIQVSMTDAEFEAKATELRHRHGINLASRVGKITKNGITAGYTHHDGVLTVHIVDKPFFITTQYCEHKLQEWLVDRSHDGQPQSPKEQSTV